MACEARVCGDCFALTAKVLGIMGVQRNEHRLSKQNVSGLVLCVWRRFSLTKCPTASTWLQTVLCYIKYQQSFRLLTLCASLAHHPESLVQKVWTEYSPGQQQPSVAQSCLQHVRDIKQGAPLHLPEVPVNLICTPPLLEGNPFYITLDMIILHIKANNHQWMDQMESSIQWNQKPKYEKIPK